MAKWKLPEIVPPKWFDPTEGCQERNVQVENARAPELRGGAVQRVGFVISNGETVMDVERGHAVVDSK